MFRILTNVSLAASLIATSTAPVHADGFIFRHKLPIADAASPTDPEVPVDPGYGIGNDITVFFTGAIGYEFSKVIPVATKDVIEWRRSKGSYQPGLTLDPDAGVISGVAAGTTDARNVVLLGYDIGGNAIARANITFNFRNPVGVPQNIVFYGHTGKHMFREIPSSGTVKVARWESMTPLPDDFRTEGRYLVGTPTNPYNTSVAFVGYDYMGKEVAFAAGNLLVQDGPTFNTIADKHQHPEDEFYAYGKVQHRLGGLTYRLIALDGKPSTLGFNSDGELEGYIRTFNTSLRFQIEAFDVDGTSGKSNVFTFSTFAPDVDISDMKNLQGTAGTQYSLKLTGEDLSGDMNWQVIAGQLPAGLSLDPDTGVISGVPTKEETQDGIVISVATSDNGYGETKPFSFEIHPEQVIVSFATENVRTNESFTTNGPSLDKGILEPHSFALAQGATVDPALSVDYATAKVSGSVSVAGDYSVPFNFVNGDGRESVFVQPIGVYNPLSLSYDNVLTVYRRVPANVLPTVPDQSVIGEGQFSLNSGALPDGLAIQPQTGLIYGAPETMGTVPGINVRLSDESGESAVSNTFSVDVQDRPDVEVAVASTDVERFVTNNLQVVNATNVFDGVTFELVAGTLPSGLSLDDDGHIVGVTEEPEGAYPGFQIRATDGEGYSALSPVFSISIVAPKNLAPLKDSSTSASWTVGVPFSLPLPRPDNAYGTITYDLQNLPAGVAVDGDRLVGRIDDLGSLALPMTLTDEGHRTLTGTFTLNILEPMTASLSGSSAQVSAFSFMRMATSAVFHLPRGSETSISAQVANGIEPISYTFQGSLPTGMAYADGIVSGTPVTENQTGSMTLAITDAAGTSVQLPANLSVVARLPIEIAYDFSKPIFLNSTSTLPRKTVVKNAIGAVAYSVTGTLPEGLKLDEKTGYFTGAPRQDGRFGGIVVTATDSEGDAFAGSYGPFEIGVSRHGAVGLASISSFTVRANESFLKTLSASNVTKPIVFVTADGGPMPHGLALGTVDGSISGTLPAEGKFDASVKVTDDFGRSKSTTVRFTVVGALAIAPPPTLSFNQHASVSVAPVVANAIGTKRYELVAGTLPAGLTLNATTGAITGTPTVKGTAAGLVIRLTDASGTTVQTPPFTLTITDRLPLTMNTATSYSVFANMNYKLTMPVTNAVGKVTFTQTGNLPAGITFDVAKGIFSGRSTAIGTFSGISVTATDSIGGTVTKTFSLVVSTNGNPINLSVTNFATKVGHPILTTKPTWSNHVGDVHLWADDTLAQYGLVIDPLTGIISGTATQLIDFTPNIHITDGSDRVTSKPINIKVIPNMVVSVPSRVDLTVNTAMTNVTATRDNVVGTATWTYEGTLPTGVSFNASAGRLSGTPTEMGTFTGIVRSTDSLGDVGSAPVTIVVANNGMPPTISVMPSASGYQVVYVGNIGMTFTNKKVGDIVSLAPSSSALPPGMTIVKNASGNWVLSKIAATQDDVGVYRGIILRVTDIDGLYTETGPMTIIYTSSPRLLYPTASFSSHANAPVSVDAPVPSEGKASADVRFAFSSKSLGGQNLTMDPVTGAIGGYITASGSNVVTVTESYDGITIRTFAYTVNFTKVDLAISAGSYAVSPNEHFMLPAPRTNNLYAEPTYTLSGNVPAEVSIDPETGIISGVISDGTHYNMTISLTNGVNTAAQDFVLSAANHDEGYKFYRFSSPNTVYYLNEFDLVDEFGASIMGLGKTMTSNINEAELAIDGDISTYARVVVSDARYLTLAFDKKIKATATKLTSAWYNQYYQCLSSFSIAGSDDGQNWVTLKTVTGRTNCQSTPTGLYPFD